jgi:hypothetical protein
VQLPTEAHEIESIAPFAPPDAAGTADAPATEG